MPLIAKQAESAIMYRELLKERQRELSRYEQAFIDVLTFIVFLFTLGSGPARRRRT